MDSIYADAFYNSEKIYNESDNIKVGTEYMQYWIDKNKNDIVQAYKNYKGKGNGIYYNKKKSMLRQIIKRS
ncbi:hypothetical protein TUM17567_30230 [Citrobacter amalonaticus]|nr:hypothetical protein TUM17567_30230 [Citrobacter amalonaticus]